METRTSKFSEKNTNFSRVSKNMDLYKKINKSELENCKVKSNATVIGKQDSEIDIEKLKKILDNRYQQKQQRKSIRIENIQEEVTPSVENTKEYDLNIVLNKAKDDKEETYEEVRNKKLRDTQFDILNKISVDEEEIKENGNESIEEDLLNLINTISINEVKNIKEKSESEPEEKIKKQDDKTIDDYERLKEEIKEIEKTSSVLNIKEENNMEDSFFTKDNKFKKSDFKDDEDDDGDNNKLSIGIKILIALIIIVFIAGVIIFFTTI